MPTFHQELNEFLAAWEPVLQLQHNQSVTPAHSPESLSPILPALHLPNYGHGPLYQHHQQQQQLPYCFSDVPAASREHISLPPIVSAVRCTERDGSYLPNLLPPLQHVSKQSSDHHQRNPCLASPPSPTTSESHPAVTPQHRHHQPMMRHAGAGGGGGGVSAAPGSSLQECGNCHTRETSAWRKDEHGRVLCNACGLYRKQRGHDRPAAFPFRKSVVRRRNRGDRKPLPGAADLAKDAVFPAATLPLGGAR